MKSTLTVTGTTRSSSPSTAWTSSPCHTKSQIRRNRLCQDMLDNVAIGLLRRTPGSKPHLVCAPMAINRPSLSPTQCRDDCLPTVVAAHCVSKTQPKERNIKCKRYHDRKRAPNVSRQRPASTARFPCSLPLALVCLVRCWRCLIIGLVLVLFLDARRLAPSAVAR